MKYTVLGMMLLLMLAPAAVTLAQQPSAPQAGASGSHAGQQAIQIDSKSLVGSTVRDDEGKDVGRVANLMIDLNQGTVTGVVISMGKTLGVGGTGITIGGKDITVPWDGVKIARDRDKMVVTLSQPMMPKTNGSTEGGSSPAASPSTSR